MPNVSIIVPTRNEGDNIKLLLEPLSISLARSTIRELEATHGFDAELPLIQSAYADEDQKEEREDGEGEKRHSAENGGKDKEDDAEGDSAWGDIYEISAKCMLFLIFVHIMGVAVSSMRHGENLVRAMFTGKKSLQVSWAVLLVSHAGVLNTTCDFGIMVDMNRDLV